MGRVVPLLVGLAVGAAAGLVPGGDAAAVSHRLADVRADHASVARPTPEQRRVRRWYRRHLAMLARTEPAPVRAPPRRRRPRPPPEPAVSHFPGYLPADAMDTGACVLRLRTVDAATGEPVRAGGSLWRLGVPGDTLYGPGDEVRWSGELEDGEVVITGLPDGAYRFECSWQRRTAEDPPPFVIEGVSADVTVPLLMPRTLPVRLRLFEPDGTEVRRATVQEGGFSSHPDIGRNDSPPWARPRERFDGVRTPGTGSWWACGGGDEDGVDVVAGPDGLLLAMREEQNRGVVWSAGWAVSQPGRVEVRCRLRGEELTPETVLVAPSVPVDLVARTTRLPDGRTLDEARMAFTASCRAVVTTDAAAETTWRDAEVRVRVPMAGARTLFYVWRLGPPGAEPSAEPAAGRDW